MRLVSSQPRSHRLFRSALWAWLGGSPLLVGCPATAPTRPQTPILLVDETLCARGAGDGERVGERDPRCAPESTHQAVVLTNHLFGCEAGLRGAVTFRLGEQVLATLHPGEQKAFRLPRGDVEVTIVEAGVESVRALSLEGSGPVDVEAGCALGAFAHMALRPLAVVARPLPEGRICPAVKVRAGGLDFAVVTGQVQTLFLPPGQHLVKVAGAQQSVEVGPDGAVLELPACGEPAAPSSAPSPERALEAFLGGR